MSVTVVFDDCVRRLCSTVGDAQELTLLRRHNRELNATVAQLRGQLAVASKEQEM